MTARPEEYTVPLKATWGDGPWQTEPDRVDFEHAGFPCLLLRNYHLGQWCGYVGVPPGHPLHGQDYEKPDVEVHGGLTYADACRNHICHTPKPGEPENVWWFGFDCAHAGDVVPGITKHTIFEWEAYRTLEYVRAETERLAEQLATK